MWRIPSCYLVCLEFDHTFHHDHKLLMKPAKHIEQSFPLAVYDMGTGKYY